jgi:hypothetical protein
MKTYLKIALALSVGFFSSNELYAQGDDRDDSHIITITIPEVALLDLEATLTKDFSAPFTHSGEAGDPIVAPSNNATIWLNYSSILKPTSPTQGRNISVVASALVPGVTIHVVAGPASSGGKGTLGSPSGQLTLTAASQNIITGVGSAYTVSGVSNGHLLTYSFLAEDGNYAALRSGVSGTPITVTYTLADN